MPLGTPIDERVARLSILVPTRDDAANQHPPELIPDLPRRGEAAGAGVTIASRFAPGGSLGTLSPVVRQPASRSLPSGLILLPAGPPPGGLKGP